MRRTLRYHHRAPLWYSPATATPGASQQNSQPEVPLDLASRRVNNSVVEEGVEAKGHDGEEEGDIEEEQLGERGNEFAQEDMVNVEDNHESGQHDGFN